MKKYFVMSLISIMVISLIAGCAPAPTNDSDPAASEQPTAPIEGEEPPVPGEDELSLPPRTEDDIDDVLPPVDEEPSEAPPMSDATFPQFVIYNSTSYIMSDNMHFLEEMIGEEIGATTGYIDFAGQFDEALLTQELANSISPDAVFYTMKNYSEDLRIAMSVLGTYYILDSTSIDAADIAAYSPYVTGGTVYSATGINELGTISKEDATKLLDIFSKTAPATLEDADYEQFGKLQSEGKAYTVNINLEDGTHVSFFTMPEVNLVSISQEYHTSESFNDDVGFVFADMPQEAEGVVY